MRLIEVNNVSKIFRPRRGSGRLLTKGGFISLFRRVKEEVVALRDISLEVEQGEAVGIIGANGSGKSTLLKLLAGVTVPTSGSIRIQGRIASLLELGAGFHPLLTGRENIYLNARILGMRKQQVNEVFDRIVDFSGIRDFIDNPVNTYSSGMYVRLGFAVAAHVNPDVFLVDEVLSVGDEEFQRKCRTRIGELREDGKTLVFVSHDLSIVNTLCDRVILLSKGRTISRGSARETIDFYLRQIGRDIGIHTFSEGDVEAIFCHGRISIFHRKREVTAATGLRMNLRSLGQYLDSSMAEWVVEERGPNYCRARGRMSRIPLSLVWELRIEENALTWRITLDGERALDLDRIAVEAFLPCAYTHWQYDDDAGIFPTIFPEDLKWTPVLNSTIECRQTLVFPDAGSSLSPLVIEIDTDDPLLKVTWMNSDYVAGARVLLASVDLPESRKIVDPGERPFATLKLDLSVAPELIEKCARDLAAQVAAKMTITSGSIAARFKAGRVVFRLGDQKVTAFLHFYASILIGGIWSDSHDLFWHKHQRTEERLNITGESRRFPFNQHWEIERVPEGIAIRIWLEARESLEMEEYHASIVLRPEYTHWETDAESGAYPPFEPGLEDWRHANRLYKIGTRATALSSTLPSVTLKVAADTIPFRLTAINTGYSENARVLQALRTPDAGRLHFEQGRHLYFSGVVSIE